MENKHTFSIDMILRKCKHDGSIGCVYARITVDSQHVEISTKEIVSYSEWNSKLEKVEGRSLQVKAVNEHLDNIRFKIKEKYRELINNNCLITAQAVKEAYLGTHTASKGHKLVELLNYFGKIWEGKMRPGGFKNYKTTIEYIKAFVSGKFASKDIYLSQLNMEIATEFEYYVRNNPIKKHDPCIGNGVAKHIQRFKRILNWAKEIQWIKTNPCDDYSCPQKKTKRKKLTIQEIVALENKDFTDPQLAYIKDLFLLSCFTGLAFADVMSLREAHFEWDLDGVTWCKIYRKKSDELSRVPLLKAAASILNKYRSASNKESNIFPAITNQQVNRSLKIIRSACEILTPMTFHVARHTFAKTIALKNGIPLETVQMMMGHAKITTTQIYADVDEEKIVDDMLGIDEKLDKKRATIKAGKVMPGLVNSFQVG